MIPNLLALAVFLAATAATAVFGAGFKPGPWYEALAKPPWTPPNWVFAPVWTALYVMIAIAGWLAWQRLGAGRAIGLWVAALVLNAAWSWLFFGQHLIGLALIDILALLVSIAAFIAATWNLARPAALLFIPYFAWVGYATSLNLAIWWLNR